MGDYFYLEIFERYCTLQMEYVILFVSASLSKLLYKRHVQVQRYNDSRHARGETIAFSYLQHMDFTRLEESQTRFKNWGFKYLTTRLSSFL